MLTLAAYFDNIIITYISTCLLWSAGHDRTRGICAEFADDTINHVDSVEEIHHFKKPENKTVQGQCPHILRLHVNIDSLEYLKV